MLKERLYKIEEELVFSTLLLSNSQDDEYIADATKIISFICDAFELDEKDKSKYIACILDKALCMCTYEDAIVYFQNKDMIKDLNSEEANIFQIKASLLRQMHSYYRASINYDEVQHYNSDYFYGLIDSIANKGRSKVIELLAILKALGIGCERNYDEAIDLLKGLIFWQPLTCVPFLKMVYRAKKDKEHYEIYSELEKLIEKNNPYRHSVLSEDDEKAFCKEARDLYKLISAFQLEVINRVEKTNNEIAFDVLGDTIDYSFAEAMASDKFNYKQKMDFINNYNVRFWVELNNRERERMGI